MAAELSGRERVWLALHHQEADRVGVMDAIWSTTLERWQCEGLPKSTLPEDAFDYDMRQIRPDFSLQLPNVTVEETEEYTVVRDGYGKTVKNWKHRMTTPDWIDFLIKTPADWEAYKHLAVWDSRRVDWDAARRTYEKGRAEGKFMYYAGAISWDATLPLIGPEAMLYALADHPDWVRDMFRAQADLYLAGAEELMGAGFAFDGAWVYDDMAYRSGPFFSPRTYDELFFPHDKRVCDFFKARGIPVILHTDGQIGPLIPRLIEAGYACLQPLEVKAGMDVVELKKQYGEVLAFMGGIDTRAMSDPDPAVIEREIAAKIPVAMKGGGYIYHSDHSVPDLVSLAQYRRVLDLVRHYGSYG